MCKVDQKSDSPALLELKVDKLLRYACLVLIVVQTTANVLLLRYSRTWNGQPYLASTAVLLSELLKLAICLTGLLIDNGFSLVTTLSLVISEAQRHPAECAKLLIPSGLYVLQNNLLFLALTNLDAATYQVTYQLKILTTALFSVCLLQKNIHKMQWLALCLLTIGVALVQFPSGSSAPTDLTNDTSTTALPGEYTNQLIGLMAVLGASVSSGFAGAYFEMLIKFGHQTSIMMKNFHMAFFSMLISGLTVLYQDSAKIELNGFFQGYNGVVFFLVALQAVGGLVVALTVKYADSILKGFATSISIICSSLLSYWLLDDLEPNRFFVAGTCLVISATFMYGSSAVAAEKKT